VRRRTKGYRSLASPLWISEKWAKNSQGLDVLWVQFTTFRKGCWCRIRDGKGLAKLVVGATEERRGAGLLDNLMRVEDGGGRGGFKKDGSKALRGKRDLLSLF